MVHKTKEEICSICGNTILDKRVYPTIPCEHFDSNIDYGSVFTKKKSRFVNFTNSYHKNILINQYIGLESYKSVSKDTRYILLKEANKEFHRRMESIYGSMSNYQRKWAKTNLGLTWYQYQTELAKLRGFKNDYEYKIYLVKKLGFKSYSDYQNYLVKKRGFRNRTDYEEQRIQKRGFKSMKQYRDKIAKDLGFKSYSERRMYWKKNQTLK